jgi:hypothetical protein
MNNAKIKKAVGSAGMAVCALSAWLTLHHSDLVAMFPRYGADITFATTVLGGLAAWWGQHPLSQ